MAKLFANSGDLDQMPHSAESDMGLHCLPSTHLRVSRLQWVNGQSHERRGSQYSHHFNIAFFFFFLNVGIIIQHCFVGGWEVHPPSETSGGLALLSLAFDIVVLISFEASLGVWAFLSSIPFFFFFILQLDMTEIGSEMTGSFNRKMLTSPVLFW